MHVRARMIGNVQGVKGVQICPDIGGILIGRGVLGVPRRCRRLSAANQRRVARRVAHRHGGGGGGQDWSCLM
jgi:hypothetical protein